MGCDGGGGSPSIKQAAGHELVLLLLTGLKFLLGLELALVGVRSSTRRTRARASAKASDSLRLSSNTYNRVMYKERRLGGGGGCEKQRKEK